MSLKFLLPVGLLLSSFAFAQSDNVLRSDVMKKSICAQIDSELYTFDRSAELDNKKCQAATFTITASRRDSRTNAVTMMTVSYAFTQSQISISGAAQLAAAIAPDRNGNMVTTWKVTSTKSSFRDSRNIVELIKAEYERSIDDIDTHNGDSDITKNPSLTLASATRELERSLPNDSCEYETSQGIDYVLGDYTLRQGLEQTELLSLLEKAKKAGKIKAAVMRTFSDGESEYCSLYRYYIIFTDGHVLYFNIDLTT